MMYCLSNLKLGLDIHISTRVNYCLYIGCTVDAAKPINIQSRLFFCFISPWGSLKRLKPHGLAYWEILQFLGLNCSFEPCLIAVATSLIPSVDGQA